MIKFNKKTLEDKIYACWLGKNIGGTMGTPYEGGHDIQDIKGFVTPPGEPLVNDDLDLQLVWLKAMEDLGPSGINERVLGEYWLTYIVPNWNEYGVCKSNMRSGVVPPMSGEINNEEWRNSNGAWIRTEIWACLYPAQPDKVINYAYYDACVDHGYGEGTYGAIFVAAMESAAFVIDDLRELIRIGLSKIPEDCRVARSVKLAVESYDNDVDWKTARNAIVEDSKDLGWFQAPANIAFTILGLLYGECDFKKSMIIAINCGDDTDCTGATCGALLGIMYGTKGIPSDWREYLGDTITSGCLAFGTCAFPKSCTQLTANVLSLLDVTTHPNSFLGYQEHERVIVGDFEDDFTDFDAEKCCGNWFAKEIGSRKRYSFCESNSYAEVLVELDSRPYIKPGETLTGTITVFKKNFVGQKHYSLRYLCEDGFTVSGDLNVHVCADKPEFAAPAKAKFTITAPEQVKSVNKIVIEVAAEGRTVPIYTQLVLFG